MPGYRKMGVAALSAATLLLLLLLLVFTGVAIGESDPTTQARADNGTRLPHAPPPLAPTGLCLVDTGVDVNPDTETTVVERTAIDNGPGDDASPEHHGTILAMLAAAPANNWGTLGTAPTAVQIVSVRILGPGQTTFPFSAYAAGITACLRIRTTYNIRVINLSLGTPSTPSSQERLAITNAAQEATSYGVAVVAAAGNDDGGPIEYPAAAPGVLAVTATDTATGALCGFSNHGPGLTISAPGCDLDAANANGAETYDYSQGTSEASAITSTALAALMAYKPSLPYQAAEEDLLDAHQGQLDITGAFELAGLREVIADGEAHDPPASTPSEARSSSGLSGVAPSSTEPMPVVKPPVFAGLLQKPRVRLARHGARLLLTVSSPGSSSYEIRIYGHKGRPHKTVLLRVLTSSRSTLALPAAGVLEVALRAIDPYDTSRDSPWSTIHAPPRPVTKGRLP